MNQAALVIGLTACAVFAGLSVFGIAEAVARRGVRLSLRQHLALGLALFALAAMLTMAQW